MLIIIVVAIRAEHEFFTYILVRRSKTFIDRLPGNQEYNTRAQSRITSKSWSWISQCGSIVI